MRSSGWSRQPASSRASASNAVAVVEAQHGGDRRVAVAHREGHVDVVPARAERAAQQHGLAPRVHQQRRALVGPDARVLARGLRRAGTQHHPVQDQQPCQARDLDHARIGQEFAQVAAHRGRRRFVGRAQLQQQHGGAGRGCAIGPARRETGHRQPWWLSAEETSLAVMSTIGITRSYAMRVGPMTPSVPTMRPSAS
jgi:hypothetical protein